MRYRIYRALALTLAGAALAPAAERPDVDTMFVFGVWDVTRHNWSSSDARKWENLSSAGINEAPWPDSEYYDSTGIAQQQYDKAASLGMYIIRRSWEGTTRSYGAFNGGIAARRASASTRTPRA